MTAYGYCYDDNDAVSYLKEKDQPRANVDAWLLMRLARMYQARHLDEKEAERLKWFLEHFENIKKNKKEKKMPTINTNDM